MLLSEVEAVLLSAVEVNFKTKKMNELNPKIFHQADEEGCKIIVNLKNKDNVKEVLEAMIQHLTDYVEDDDFDDYDNEHHSVAPFFGFINEGGEFELYKHPGNPNYTSANPQYFYEQIIELYPELINLVLEYVNVATHNGPVLGLFGEYNVGAEAIGCLAYEFEKYVPEFISFMERQDLNHPIGEYGFFEMLLDHYKYNDSYVDIAIALMDIPGQRGCDLLADYIKPDIPEERMNYFLKKVCDYTYDMDKKPIRPRDLGDDITYFYMVFESVFPDAKQEEINKNCNEAVNNGIYPTVNILLGKS